MVFIKTEIIPLLKFCPKLNRMSCPHQSHYATCLIINLFILKNFKIIFFNKEKKNKKFWGWPSWPLGRGWLATPFDQFGGGEPPHGWMGVAEPSLRRFLGWPKPPPNPLGWFQPPQ